MRDEYDFTESSENPFAKKIRRPVTLRLDIDVIDYFKGESVRTGIPYQNIINMYLSECAHEGKKLTFV